MCFAIDRSLPGCGVTIVRLRYKRELSGDLILMMTLKKSSKHSLVKAKKEIKMRSFFASSCGHDH
jgi:hypothetical protein